MPVDSKSAFVQVLKDALAKKDSLPVHCASCGSDLIYLDAVFQVYGEHDGFILPLGFCPCCDGIPRVHHQAVA